MVEASILSRPDLLMLFRAVVAVVRLLRLLRGVGAFALRAGGCRVLKGGEGVGLGALRAFFKAFLGCFSVLLGSLLLGVLLGIFIVLIYGIVFIRQVLSLPKLRTPTPRVAEPKHIRFFFSNIVIVIIIRLWPGALKKRQRGSAPLKTELKPKRELLRNSWRLHRQTLRKTTPARNPLAVFGPRRVAPMPGRPGMTRSEAVCSPILLPELLLDLRTGHAFKAKKA